MYRYVNCLDCVKGGDCSYCAHGTFVKKKRLGKVKVYFCSKLREKVVRKGKRVPCGTFTCSSQKTLKCLHCAGRM